MKSSVVFEIWNFVGGDSLDYSVGAGGVLYQRFGRIVTSLVRLAAVS